MVSLPSEAMQMEVLRHGLLITAKRGHHEPSQSSASTVASDDPRRCRVEILAGAMSALALTKLGTIRDKGFLASIAARNTVNGRR